MESRSSTIFKKKMDWIVHTRIFTWKWLVFCPQFDRVWFNGHSNYVLNEQIKDLINLIVSLCWAQKYLDKAFLDPNCQVLVILLGTKTRWHFILLYLMPWIDSFWFFPLCSTYCLVFVIHYLHYDFVIWGNLMFTTLICTHVDSAENFLDHLPWVFHSEFSMGQEKQTSCTAVLPCWSWMEDTDISFFFFFLF